MNRDDFVFNFAFGYGALPKDEHDLKQSHHLWLDSIVYGGDKTEFHEIVEANSIPEKGDKYYMKGIGRGKNIRYISYFYNILEQYQSVSPHLIFVLDWKADVPTLKWHIEKALAGTDFKPVLPPSESYPGDASILYGFDANDKTSLGPVFKDYTIALDYCGLQLILIESYGDEFVFYIHKTGTPLEWTKTALFFRSLSCYPR